jgi:transcriptional regulator with XRE-family HTH domain
MTHIPRLTQDRQALVEGKLMHLRLHLALVMRALREEAGFTQQELAETLGIQQAAVSKLESHTKDHKLESIVRQLSALDAELLVAVKKGDEIFQVSDDEEHLVVDVPTQVSAWARECELDTRDYVLRALDYYHDFNSRSPVTPRTPTLVTRTSETTSATGGERTH